MVQGSNVVIRIEGPSRRLLGCDSVKCSQTSHWRWKQQGPPKLWYPTVTVCGVTNLKTSTRTSLHV